MEKFRFVVRTLNVDGYLDEIGRSIIIIMCALRCASFRTMQIWISKQSQPLSLLHLLFGARYSFIVAFFFFLVIRRTSNLSRMIRADLRCRWMWRRPRIFQRFNVKQMEILIIKFNIFRLTFSPQTDYQWNAGLIRFLMCQKDKPQLSGIQILDGIDGRMCGTKMVRWESVEMEIMIYYLLFAICGRWSGIYVLCRGLDSFRTHNMVASITRNGMPNPGSIFGWWIAGWHLTWWSSEAANVSKQPGGTNIDEYQF